MCKLRYRTQGHTTLRGPTPETPESSCGTRCKGFLQFEAESWQPRAKTRTGLYTLYTTSNVQAKPHSLHLDSDDTSISLLPWHFTCYPVFELFHAFTSEELRVPLFVVRIVFCRAIEGACKDEGGPCNDGPHTGKVPTKASNAASLYVCTWVSILSADPHPKPQLV